MSVQGPSSLPHLPLVPRPVQKSDRDGADKPAQLTPVPPEKLVDKAASSSKVNLAGTEFFDSSHQVAQDALLSRLLVNSPQSHETATVLAQFLEYKNSPLIEQRFQAVNLAPSEVGIKEWLIGMVGMLYDPSNQDPALLQSIITRLLAFVTADQELFLLGSSLKAIGTRLDELPDPFLQKVVSTIQNSGVIDRSEGELGNFVRNFVDSLSLRGLSLELVPVASNTAKVSMSERANTRLAELLMQARALTYFAADNEAKDHWMMLYSAFLGIETTLSLLDEDSYPYLSEEIALLIDSSTHLPDRFNIVAIQTLDSQSKAQYLSEVAKERLYYLFGRQFKRVFALMPHHLFSEVYAHVEQAVLEHPSAVKLFDLGTFGPGLSELVVSICEGLYLSGVRKNAEGLINQAISRYRYWVAPQYSVLARHSWFSLIPRRRPLRANLLPILALYGMPTAVQAVATIDDVCKMLVDYVLDELAMDYPYRRIVVTYRLHYRPAVELQQTLKNQTGLDVELRQADASVAQYWGDHLSVSLI